jgi:hypothetical protein
MPYFVINNSSQCRPFDDKLNAFDWRIHYQCLLFKERELEIVRPEVVVWIEGATPRNYFWQKFRSIDSGVISKLQRNTVLNSARSRRSSIVMCE